MGYGRRRLTVGQNQITELDFRVCNWDLDIATGVSYVAGAPRVRPGRRLCICKVARSAPMTWQVGVRL